MRLLVCCPSGESRLLQIDGEATVLEVKQRLEAEEGIPCNQQVLVFTGQHLKDHLTLNDHNLQEFTLAAEVILYLSRRLSNPKRIMLATAAKLNQPLAEHVEADMPVGEVSALLESRGMATTCPHMPILVKRQGGSTVPITVNPAESIAHLEMRIAKQEGINPSVMTFLQAQDGSLHCTVWPSADEPIDTYPVYRRSVMPQPIVQKRKAGPGKQMFSELVKELCVLP